MTHADTDIWKLFIKGDNVAFEQLMKLHFKPLFSYGTKYTPDSELVKDCIQELFMGIWDRRARLSTEVNPKLYLMASLRRALHRKLQAEGRFLKQEGEKISDYFDFQLSVEQKLIDNESAQLLTKRLAGIVAALPKRQKEVVYFKFFQNFSRDEIAAIIGNNPQTVSNLLQMALKRLRSDFTIIVFLIAVVGTNSWLF